MRKIKFLSSVSLAILALVSLSSFRPTFVQASDCGGPVPQAPTNVKAVSGPKANEVTLYWDTAPYANHYAVVYGTASNKYIYGSLNIGGERARSFVVGYLSPGTRYYFRLVGVNNGCSGPYSSEVSVVVMGGVAEAAGVVLPKQVTQAVGAPAISVNNSKDHLTASSGPNAGEVTLNWQNTDNADNYHLVYGTKPGKNEYGALNIGKTTAYTVRLLSSGVTYHFALVPVIGGRALYTTSEVTAVAKTEVVYVEVVQTAPENVVQPPSPTIAPPSEAPLEELPPQIQVQDNTGTITVPEVTNPDENISSPPTE